MKQLRLVFELLQISIRGVITMRVQANTMRISITIHLDRETTETTTMIDSGAGGEFNDSTFAHNHNVFLEPLTKTLPVYNADGTPNH